MKEGIDSEMENENLFQLTAKQSAGLTDDLSVHQRELEKTRNRYMDLYDFAPVGYVTLDEKGVIREANLAGAAMLGIERDFLLSQPFSKFVHGDDHDHFYLCLRKLMATKTRGVCELRLVPPQGTAIHVHLEAVAVGEEETGGAEIRAVIHDVTAHRMTEKALKFESFAVMTGGIAHDYNNLLSMILGNISLARDETGPESHIAGFLQDAEEASLRAKDLTHRLMLLSKESAPQKRAISIKETLETCAAKLPPASNYRLMLSIARNLRPVLHDPYQLKYAIKNILVNAMESMPDGGILTLKAENTFIGETFKNSLAALGHGEYVKISISDQGMGIPRENISKIFDPYFSTKKGGVKKGTGMGLATAYAVTAKHGGQINVQSTVGTGTTVSIYLPVLESETEKALFTTPMDKSEIKKILLMDDEEMLRKLVQEMLNRLGYEVQTARDGAEAVRLYQTQKTTGTPFDVVILDLTIKDGMGGVDTLKKLKAIDSEVKAVVSSGYFDDPVMSDFRAYGFCDAIPKPYQVAELKSVLEKFKAV